MNKVAHHNQPHHDPDELCHQTLNNKGSARYTTCVVLMLVATWAPVILANAQAYDYLDPARRVGPTNVPTSQPVAAFHRNARYHGGMASLELEQAVIRAAQQHHVQPALLLAVMKAESSFNPIVISKAGQ